MKLKIGNLKLEILILAALLLPMVGRAAEQSLASVPKMTAAEAAETVLAEGVLVRITDSTPLDVRVGDGLTAGGVQIGDGNTGWVEGNALTQSLDTGGHSVTIGEGFTFYAASSKLYISAFGTIIMEAFSDVASINLSIAYDGTNLNLTTPLGFSQPTIQYTTNLLSISWADAPIASVVTNVDTYVFNILPTNFGNVVYFRAAVSSSGSSVNFIATLQQNGEPVALAHELTAVSNQAASAVTSVVINGVTNVPVQGVFTFPHIVLSVVNTTQLVFIVSGVTNIIDADITN